MGQTLSVSNVTKRFGAKTVLDNLSLSAERGEFVVLVGPSGCGKSTMLRVIAGLEEIDSGKVDIGGRDVTALPPRQRNVAMVFQDYALYPHKTVFENIAFGLRVRGETEAVVRTKVGEAATKLSLGPMLDRKPASLSGGQRQRVAIGRALVRDPDLFLFDEPLSNLDAKLRGTMRVTIAKLHEELKATSVYVTHDQVEAMTLADRIIIMEGGHIQQVGTPMDVYNSPRNAFVASFIGSPPMNMMPGRVITVGGSLTFESKGGIKTPLPAAVSAAVTQRGRVGATAAWGIRPEQFHLVAAASPGSIAARVVLAESLGPETSLYCDVAGEEVYVKLHSQDHPKKGDQVHLAFDQTGPWHLFDSGSGQSLVHL